ncbi:MULTISPECIES: YdcH family protein [Marinobacter]|uniref:YdcH family protein n=1 Tax=Marinobacter TaxID=2742 RepID=UPI001248BD53|nr:MULTISPECIES: YdcH family protein [Marinobacter]MBL3556957.1 YdcH family protein [Marinobacter sp. JB05H06]MDX1553803.1 YdcH family protein [Marinobacter sp.]
MGISNHELHNEFPQFKELIDELKTNDLKFKEHFQQYAELDQEIEGLELRDSPIGDDKLHRMKQKRLQLKDDLYKTLVRKSNGAG